MLLLLQAKNEKTWQLWTTPGVQCYLHYTRNSDQEGNAGQSTQVSSVVAMCNSKHCQVLVCRDFLRNVPGLVVGNMPTNCVWIGYSPITLGIIVPVRLMSCIV